MDITAGVAGAVVVVKKLLELKTIAKDAEAKLLIADLQLQLADVKTTAADLMNEKLQLAERLRRATEPPPVMIKEGLYFKEDEDGPFCTTCYDRDGKMIRLIRANLKEMHAMGHTHHCGVCKMRYNSAR